MALHPSFRFGWRLYAIALGVIVLGALVAHAQFPPVRPSTVRGIPTIPLAAESTAVKDLAGNPVFIQMPPNPNFPSSPGPTPFRPGTPVPTVTNPPFGLVGTGASGQLQGIGGAGGINGIGGIGGAGGIGGIGGIGGQIQGGIQGIGGQVQGGIQGIGGNFQGAAGIQGGVGGFSGGQGFGGGIYGFQIVPGVFVLPQLPAGYVGSMSGGVGFNGGFQGQFQGVGGLQGF